MNLRDVREYYGKSSRVVTFMCLLFTVVIAGLSIYVADIISSSTEEAGSELYCLYTVFVVGAILIILGIIACIMGRKESYEAAFGFRKFLAVVSFAVGVICLYASMTIIIDTHSEWNGDEYTAVIFITLLVSSILTVMFSIAGFVYAFTGSKYYDTGKNAKDIPEKMTLEGNYRKYMLVTAVAYSVISTAVALLGLYFSKQIEYYSEIKLEEVSVFAAIYNVLFVAGVIMAVVELCISALMCLQKNNRLPTVSRLGYMAGMLLQVVFVFVSVVAGTQKFVKAQYPDISYIIFAVIMIIIAQRLAVSSLLTARKINQSHKE